MIKKYKISLILISLSLFVGLCFYYVSNGFCRLANAEKTKILLIGIEGITWKIINPMIKEGKLPNIAKLINMGAHGVLDNTDEGMGSPEIWTTIATGKNSEKHGIKGFFIHEKGIPGTIRHRSYHRKTKAIWNILSEGKRKVGVINYRVIHPPEKINGFMISQFFEGTYPEELMFELDQLNASQYQKYLPDDISDISLKRCYKELVRVTLASKYLQKKELNFLMLYIKFSDEVFHKFWKFMEPEYFTQREWGLVPEKITRYKNVIKDYYHTVDKLLIGEIIKDIDKNTTIIITSGHGFKRNTSFYSSGGVIIDINKMLEKTDMLSFKKNSKEVDFLNSKIYDISHDPYGLHHKLYVNVKDKNALEYRKLKERVIKIFSDISFVSNNEKLFEVIEDTGDSNIFDIAIVEKAKIRQLWKKGKYIFIEKKKYLINDFLKFRSISGIHDYEDTVVIVAGKSIKRGKVINPSIFDITPTVLYLMGLRVAKDMDGGVLTNAIKESYLKRYPIKYIETYDKEKVGEAPPKKLTPLRTNEKIKSIR